MELNKNITKSVLLVVFSGRQQGIASMTIFEFKNFLENQYPEYDKLFLKDERVLWYTKGITGISVNVQETIDYLKKYISGYSKVIFIGSSMGAYASLLYGSILNVDTIIAFRPQTFLSNTLDNFTEFSDNSDVKDFINDTTKYYIYGDSSITDENDIHSINYCDRLKIKDNIVIFRIPIFDIKKYKDEGLLYEDFKKII